LSGDGSEAAGVVAWRGVMLYNEGLWPLQNQCTAAHCVQGRSTYSTKVVVGRHQLYINSGKPVMHKTSRIIANSQYPGNTLFMQNDIALIRLATPAVFNEYVNKISMASYGNDFLGQDCVLIGWGRYNKNTNALSNTLQELQTTVISRSECEYNFSRYGWKIYNSHICFKSRVSQATACHGDSGGPAVCKRYGQWVLVGLTSGGSPYCDLPANIYTRISSFRSWISSNAGL